jgi:hypothetical protein
MIVWGNYFLKLLVVGLLIALSVHTAMGVEGLWLIALSVPLSFAMYLWLGLVRVESHDQA